MKAQSIICIFGIFSWACVPAGPAEEPSPEVQSPEPVQDGAIPWAPGEGPGEAREVGEQPRSSDEPISGAYEGAAGDGVVGGGQTGGCTGKVTLPLRAEVQARTFDLKDCNSSAPSDFRGEGTVRYTVRVGADGQVETLYQLDDSLKLSAVTACVEAKLKERFEERPVGGCAQFVVPYTLVVKEAQGSTPELQENTMQK